LPQLLYAGLALHPNDGRRFLHSGSVIFEANQAIVPVEDGGFL
jgi:hypothetical protein